MRCLNKERKKVAGYFLFSIAAMCVKESQIGFIYLNNKNSVKCNTFKIIILL
uniref:hypothetical protein n=1 Tax=Bacillus cytotoxicus TaxID=580165 RepID=UPI00203EFFEB